MSIKDKCCYCSCQSFETFWKKPVYDEDFISFLQSFHQFYPIITKICTYLPLCELESILQIFANKSDSWTLAATRELQTRIQSGWLVARGAEIRISNHFFHSNLSNVIIAFNSSAGSKGKKSGEVLEERQQHSVLKYCMFKEMKNVVLGVDYVQFHYKGVALPGPCCAFYFPKIPNIEIVQFTYGPTKSNEVWETLLSENEKLECLLMFTKNDSPTRNISILEQQLRKIQPNEPLAIAGGCVFEMFHSSFGSLEKRNIKDNAMHCFAFKSNCLLPNNFYAASIVIQQPEDFEERAKFFTSKLKIKQEAILFRLCCSSKTDIQENDILGKLIDCPIFGIDVEGEIGINYYGDQQESEYSLINSKKRRKRESWEYFHGFTTILLYISWGPVKKT